MPVQTSSDYTAAHGAAFEGQKVDLQLANIISKTCETSDIPFGRAVVRGTGDDQCLLPSATGQSFVGVTLHTTDGVEQADGDHLYEQYREANILDFGEIWVYTEQSVVPGDAVYFRHTADTAPLNIVGRFRKDASGGDADLIQGAAFTSTTAAGAYAKVKLNAPGTGILLAPDSSETVTATTSVSALTTSITYVDTTLGAMALSLADGTEGQIKKIMMTVDGGDCIITPANLAVGATLRLTEVFSSYTLQFSGTSWKVIAREGKAIVTITAATTAVMPLDVDIFLFDTTVGASTGAIAAGYPGQIVKMKMTVDGGDQVITPALLLDTGTIITFDSTDFAEIMSDGTNWMVVGTPTATVS